MWSNTHTFILHRVNMRSEAESLQLLFCYCKKSENYIVPNSQKDYNVIKFIFKLLEFNSTSFDMSDLS